MVAVCCSTIVSVCLLGCACASDISSSIGGSAFNYSITDNVLLIEFTVLAILPKFYEVIIYSQGVARDRAALPLRISARVYSSNCCDSTVHRWRPAVLIVIASWGEMAQSCIRAAVANLFM